MSGILIRMSFRTLGTSLKKKRAKMPPAAPKPAAIPPLFEKEGLVLRKPRRLESRFGIVSDESDMLRGDGIRGLDPASDCVTHAHSLGRQTDVVERTYYLASLPRLMPWKWRLV